MVPGTSALSLASMFDALELAKFEGHTAMEDALLSLLEHKDFVGRGSVEV